jgi:PAS domain S-box-containing protein
VGEKSILVIDDNRNSVEMLIDLLGKHGYEPIAAGTGKDAITLYKRNRPLAALVDLKLPDINGIDLIRKFRRHAPHLPCIVITGYASQESAIEAVNVGAYAYVKKPYDIDQLLQTLRHAIERGEYETKLSIFKKLVDHSSDAFFVIDAELGAIVDTNETACGWLGYTPEELLGMRISDIAPSIADNFIQKEPSRKAGRKINPPTEHEARRKDGTTFPVEVAIDYSAIKGRGLFIAVVRDITERKQTQSNLSSKIKELEKFNRMAVDRELKMVELKKEVNGLLVECGKKKKYTDI